MLNLVRQNLILKMTIMFCYFTDFFNHFLFLHNHVKLKVFIVLCPMPFGLCS